MALEGKSKRAVRPDWIIRQEFHLDGNLKVLLLELPQIHLSLHLDWNTLSPQPVSLHEATLNTGERETLLIAQLKVRDVKRGERSTWL